MSQSAWPNGPEASSLLWARAKGRQDALQRDADASSEGNPKLRELQPLQRWHPLARGLTYVENLSIGEGSWTPGESVNLCRASLDKLRARRHRCTRGEYEPKPAGSRRVNKLPENAMHVPMLPAHHP